MGRGQGEMLGDNSPGVMANMGAGVDMRVWGEASLGSRVKLLAMKSGCKASEADSNLQKCLGN
jgi:hypothetical protein